MKLGRIRRGTKKVWVAAQSHTKHERTLSVKVTVDRRGYSYMAFACFGHGGRMPIKSAHHLRLRRGAETCSRAAFGRTPQSAVAKALAALARDTASRGRR